MANKLYKVLVDFGSYNAGNLIQLSDEDYKSIVEFQKTKAKNEDKPVIDLLKEIPQDKKAPTGSLKSFVAGLLMFGAMFLGVGSAQALDDRIYTVSASSYPVTEAAYTTAQIDGNIQLEKLIIASTAEVSSHTAVVTMYSSCDSTTTVTAQMVIPVRGGGVDPIIIDFTSINGNALPITDVCFRKDSASYTVYVNAVYR